MSNPATKRKERTPSPLDGRPTIYNPQRAVDVYELALLGYTNEQIAEAVGISIETLYGWQRSHLAFREALKNGKARADAKVARGLYERATGYSHKAVKIFMPAGAENPVYAEYTEHYPPDTGAATNWLANRQPKLWRSDPEPLPPSITVNIGDLELSQWIAFMLLKGQAPAAIVNAIPRVLDEK